MDDVLLPLCEELHINLVTSAGFQSITSAVKVLQRAWNWSNSENRRVSSTSAISILLAMACRWPWRGRWSSGCRTMPPAPTSSSPRLP